jgi:CBS domain-containing protein
MSGATVEEIMRKDYPELTPAMPIRTAVARLVESAFSALPVVEDDGAIVGILSQKDCFRPALHASYYQEWTGCVADHMSTSAVTIERNEDAFFAAEMFLSHSFRILPVMDGRRSIGVLIRSDVLAYLARNG